MEGETASSSQQPTNHMTASTVSLPSSSNPPPLAAPPPSTSIVAASTPSLTVANAPQNPLQNSIQVGGIPVGSQQQQHPPALIPTPIPTHQQHQQQQTQIPNASTGQPTHQTMVPTQANLSAGQPRQGITPIRGRQQQQQSQSTSYSHFSSMSPSASAMQQQRGSIPMQGMGTHSRPPALVMPPSYTQTPRGNMTGQPQGTPNSSMMSSGQTDQVSSMQAPFSTAQAGQKQGSVPSGQTLSGIQSISGVVSNTLSPQVRPVGAFGHSQQRPVQGSLRSQSPSQHQSLNQQKMHMSHFPRPQPGPIVSPLPGMSQGGSSSAVSGIPHQQQWMSSQGKQMHPSSLSPSPFQSHLKQQNVQQRPHGHSQQQSHPLTPQQQHVQQMQEQQPQQFQSQRMPQSMQQPMSRTAGLTPQKTSIPSGLTSNLPPSTGTAAAVGSNDPPTETSNKILGKRQIQELLSQLDPHEKLDPDVEDIMIEIAEDFVDKIFPHACTLAKHRKSEILEPKDILLPLERYWNMTVPGFASDEYKTYKRPSVNENHKQRLAAIRRSVTTSQTGAETVNAKGSGGQATGHTSGKGQATKGSQEAPLVE